MAVRNEVVRLSLDDDFTTGAARVAAATALMRRSLDDLDGSGVSVHRSLSETAVGVDQVGSSARKNGPEIDKLSGRLRLFRDAAVTLGPALVPLGAAAIPVLTGAMVGLGAAAGGIATAALAFSGLGDALDSLNKYQAEPTAENLQAMRVEMEKLGPAGAHFVKYLDGLSDELQSLQFAARDGLFPGLEDGIDAALQRLPGVRKIVRELAEGMGQLASSAGRDFAPGGDWDNFFRYLDTDGQRTLLQFGNGLGDIANGLADMLVAFAPVTRQFTDGFESMAQSFADWAAGLGDNDTFQGFLDYIRQSGPQAIDFLGSLATALASIAQALAPYGAVVLPVLTALLDVIQAIAASPLGPALVAGAAGLTLYSRAADLAAASQARFSKAMTVGFAGAGPAAAVALLAVAVVELVDAFDKAETAAERWQGQVDDGTFRVKEARAEIEAMRDDIDTDSFGEFFKNAFDPDVWVAFTQEAFGARTEVEQLEEELRFLAPRFRQAGDLSDLFGQSIGLTGRQMRIAAGDAEEFSGALAELNGWFDKRAAIRDYRASIRELSRSIRNGFTRQDLLNLDAIGENIIQVATQIKDKSVRAEFLEGAQRQLEILAKNGGPKAREEINRVIEKMREVGLLKAEPKIDPDDKKVEEKKRKTKQSFDIMDALAAKPKIEADDTEAQRVIRRTRESLSRIPDENVYLNVIRRGVTNAASQGVGPGAINNSPRIGSGGRTTGRVGMVAGRIGGVGPDDTVTPFNYGSFGDKGAIIAESNSVANALRGLNAQLQAAETALARETRQRDAVLNKMSSLSSDVVSGLRSDIFAQPSNVWAQAQSPNDILRGDIAKAREFTQLVKQLKAKGLDGPALAELLMSGDIDRARLYAAMSASDLREYERLYEQRDALLNQAGQVSANAAYGAELRKQTQELREAKRELREIKAAIKAADKNNKDGHKGTKDGVTFQATSGRRGLQLAMDRGHR